MASPKLYMNCCYLLLVFMTKEIGRKVHISPNNMHEGGQNPWSVRSHVTVMFPKEARLSGCLLLPMWKQKFYHPSDMAALSFLCWVSGFLIPFSVDLKPFSSIKDVR